MQRIKAALFVYIIRHFLHGDVGDIRRCPVCGDLLQFYKHYGWLHIVDGDADCYGALSYGKGKRRND